MRFNRNTYFKDIKDNWKDRIQLEIGDSKQDNFISQTKIMRWDNEVNFSVRLIETDEEKKETPLILVEDGKIKYKKSKRESHFYDLPDSNETPEGASEFEIILNEKPESNIVSFTIEDKNVVYYKQVREQYENGFGELEWSCDENADGSYAIYSSEEKKNSTNSKEYKCGKVGHIYRPKIIDANGVEVWGELNIDNKLLTVTISQYFLDNAVYPVRHAAGLTIGYTGAGVNSYQYYGRSFAYKALSVTAGTINTITFYQHGDAGYIFTLGIANLDHVGSSPFYGVPLSPTANVGVTASNSWVTTSSLNVGIAAVNSVQYIIESPSYVGYYHYDSTGMKSYDMVITIFSGYPTSNFLVDPTGTYYGYRKMSIYATYAEATTTTTTTAAPAYSSIKVYNGSSFVLKPLKRWNGSSWVNTNTKRWNGTSWVSI